MAQLIAAKCPTCGAGLRLNPALDFVLCQFCSTSSFIRTKTRPVPEQVAQQHSPVINVAGRGHGGLIALGVVIVAGGFVPVGIALLGAARSLALSPAASAATPAQPSAAPLVTVAEPNLPAPVTEDSAAANAASNADALPPKASAGGKPTSQSTASAKAPRGRVSAGQITVSGRLAPDVVRRVVGGNTSRFRMCYEQGLGRSSTLSGRVAVRFVIGRDGRVSNVSNGGSDLADAAAANCVLSAFYGLNFPAPEGGIVTVSYPLIFRPEQ